MSNRDGSGHVVVEPAGHEAQRAYEADILKALLDIRALLVGKLNLGFTEQEAADTLRVSTRFMRSLRARGLIGYSVLPGAGEEKPTVRYQLTDLTEYLSRNKFKP